MLGHEVTYIGSGGKRLVPDYVALHRLSAVALLIHIPLI